MPHTTLNPAEPFFCHAIFSAMPFDASVSPEFCRCGVSSFGSVAIRFLALIWWMDIRLEGQLKLCGCYSVEFSMSILLSLSSLPHSKAGRV